MKTISTQWASFLTGTAIADAVQSYALGLASLGRVDIVDIPVALPDGHEKRASFLVGWLMDVTTTTTADDHPELEDATTVDELARRAGLLGPPRAQPFSPADLSADWPDLDLDFAPQREHA